MLVTILCHFKSWKYFFQAEMTVWIAKFSCGCLANYPDPRAINSMEQTTLFWPLLASHEFFPIYISIFPMIDKCRCFFYFWDKLRFSKVHRTTYISHIQKESMSPSIFEVWNENIFSFNAKMFFLHSKQEMVVSSYTGVWSRNV